MQQFEAPRRFSDATRSYSTRACAETLEPNQLNWVALDDRVHHGPQNTSLVSAATDFAMPTSFATASISSRFFTFAFPNVSERQPVPVGAGEYRNRQTSLVYEAKPILSGHHSTWRGRFCKVGN